MSSVLTLQVLNDQTGGFSAMLHGSRGGAVRARGGFALLAAVLGALLLTLTAAAQEQPLRVTISGLDTASWPSGQAVATVLDESGRPVAGLDSKAFEVTLDGTRVPVTQVTQGIDNTLPISIVLVLDVSNSMVESNSLEPAKDAARRFLEGLGPEDSVAILTFAENVNTVLAFTKDKAAADAAIAGLGAGSSTALYEATAQSVRLAGTSETGRRAVVLLSDGVDNGSAVLREQAIGTATNAGVPVFGIGLGTEIDREYLAELAQATGGRFVETPSHEGLDALYQEASELLRGQYILAIDGSAIRAVDGRPLALQLDVASEAGSGSDARDVCLQPLCASLGIEDGERISGSRDVTVTVISTDPVSEVALLIDGAEVLSTSDAPYVFAFDAGKLDGEAHTLAARVTTEGGEQVLGETAITVGAKGGLFSSSLLLIGALVVGGVIVAGALVMYLRGRRRPGEEPPPEPAKPPRGDPSFPVVKPRRPLLMAEPSDAGPALDAAPTAGYLQVTTGPLAGQSFPISNKPTSIGTGHRCRITLDDPDGLEIGAEHARVWIRDDHLMLHELRRLSSYGPAGGRWAILSPGETFSISQYTFRFDLGSEPQAKPAPAGPVPNVLRSNDEPAPTGTAPSVLLPHNEPAPAGAVPNVPRPHDEPAPAGAVPNVLRPQDEPAGNGAAVAGTAPAEPETGEPTATQIDDVPPSIAPPADERPQSSAPPAA
jgi:VWFA-related protein